MGHDHAHRRSGRAGPLWWAAALTAGVLVVEATTAVVTDSLALLSDAGHVLTDLVGLAMALAAIHLADRGTRRSSRSFGLYRLEILAALGNAVLLFGVAGFVIVEAARRVGDAPHVPSTPVLVVAVIGLAANLVAYGLLRPGADDNLNVRAAALDVLADAVGSVGVIVAAAVLAVTGWTWVDPVVGAALGVWILPRTWRLAAAALRVLLQAAPAGIDVEALAADLADLPDVVDVHDVHVWTLTSEMDVASAHLMVADEAGTHAVLDRARELLATRYGVDHATLQVEPADHTGCDEIAW